MSNSVKLLVLQLAEIGRFYRICLEAGNGWALKRLSGKLTLIEQVPFRVYFIDYIMDVLYRSDT